MWYDKTRIWSYNQSQVNRSQQVTTKNRRSKQSIESAKGKLSKRRGQKRLGAQDVPIELR